MKKCWKNVEVAWAVAAPEGLTGESIPTIFLDEADAVRFARQEAHRHRAPYRVYRMGLSGLATHQEAVFTRWTPTTSVTVSAPGAP